MIWLWFVPYRNATDCFSSPSSTILRCDWNFRRWGLSDKLDCANYSFQRNPDSYPFPSLLPAPCEVKNLVPYMWLPSGQVQEAKRTQDKLQEPWAEKTFLLQIVLWGSLGTTMRSQHCRGASRCYRRFGVLSWKECGKGGREQHSKGAVATAQVRGCWRTEPWLLDAGWQVDVGVSWAALHTVFSNSPRSRKFKLRSPGQCLSTGQAGPGHFGVTQAPDFSIWQRPTWLIARQPLSP